MKDPIAETKIMIRKKEEEGFTFHFLDGGKLPTTIWFE